MQTVSQTLDFTNAQLMYQQHRAFSKGEFLKWLGIRLAMIAEPKQGSLNVHWKTAQEQGTIHMPSNYSTRFKIDLLTFYHVYV